MAAALFDAMARDRGVVEWSAATAAGEDPGSALSPDVIQLLSGTQAEPFLLAGPARLVQEVRAATHPALVVVIDTDPADAGADRRWRLAHQTPDEDMRQEISVLVEGLIDEIAETGPGLPGPA
jgi:hypothetical protein